MAGGRAGGEFLFAQSKIKLAKKGIWFREPGKEMLISVNSGGLKSVN